MFGYQSDGASIWSIATDKLDGPCGRRNEFEAVFLSSSSIFFALSRMMGGEQMMTVLRVTCDRCQE